MTTTLTPNLRLRIDSKLTSNAKYNLQRIDLLGATFLVDSTNTLKIRSQSDILIDPNSPDLGGSGQGSVTIGDPDRKASALTVHADELLLDGAFNLLDQAETGTGKLGLKYKSDINGSADSGNLNLNIDVDGASRNLVLGGNLSLIGNDLILNVTGPTDVTLPESGTLSTLDGVETLTNKTIDAEQNTLSNISNTEIKDLAGIEYSKLELTDSIDNDDISSTAAIAYSKLNLAGEIVDADVSASAAIAYSKLELIDSLVDSDINSDAAIAYSKLALSDSITNDDISSESADRIEYSKLNLADGIVDADVSSTAAIAYSKLELSDSIEDSDISSTAAIAYGKLALADSIVNADIAASAAIDGTKIVPQFGAQDIRTSGILELDNGTHITSLAPASSGQTESLILRLPNSNGAPNAILSTDGAGNLEWSSAGSGSVTSVDLAAPAEFIVSGNPVTTAGTLTLTKANQESNQVYAGPATGAAAEPTFRSLVLADLPPITSSDVGLDNVDNTSDADKPISTATQLALDDKYDASNPANYIDAVAAAAASPVQSVAGKVGDVLLEKADVGLDNVPNVDATDPANIVQSASYRFVTDTEKSTWNGKQDALGFTPEDSANKGQPDGYAPLDALGKIDASYLDININAINELTGDVTAGPASGSEAKAATIAAGAITDSKVSASAAIAVSKLATGTNGQVLQVVAGVPSWGAAPVSVAAFKADWVTADGTLRQITHNLGTTDIMIQVFDKATGQSIEVDTAIRTSNNIATLTASSAPGASGWRVLILAL
jgi:hypothetical protein